MAGRHFEPSAKQATRNERTNAAMSTTTRIILDRDERGLWNWTLTVRGEQYQGSRGELSAELAVQAAEVRRNHQQLFKNRKTA
jgi:hypothetical protein